MSVEKLPVFENFPAAEGQNAIVLWIKDKIFRPVSAKINFLLSLVNSGFVEIPADDVPPGADGNWRWRVDGDNLILQNKVAGAWTDTAIKMLPTGEVRMGDVDGTDFSSIEPDGTYKMNGDATVWNDVQFPISSAKVPAVNFPNWETFTANTNEYAFDVDEYIDTQANEMWHTWKEGTAAKIHLHITNKAAQATGANRYAKFTVWVSYASVGGAWQETSFTAEITIPTGTAALTNLYLVMGDLDLTGYLIGGQIKCRVKRIAATGGVEYASSMFITQVGMHMEEDTVGSRAERTK